MTSVPVFESLWVIHHGDNADVLPTLTDASVDAVVCDPPAGIGFMQKKWDKPGVLGVSGGKAMPATTSSRNPSCRSCGKHKRGKGKCNCEAPDFDETSATARHRTSTRSVCAHGRCTEPFIDPATICEGGYAECGKPAVASSVVYRWPLCTEHVS